MNTVDITNLSDAALDAVLAVKSGEDTVDASKLTVDERRSVAQALGWDLNAYVRDWIHNDYPVPNGRRGVYVGPDIEEMILAEQDERWEG